MELKKIALLTITAAMLSNTCVTAGSPTEASIQPGTNLTKGEYKESAEETQKLIDNRPDIQRRMENIDRGTVAVKVDNGVFISWRWLGTESSDTLYNIYRNGKKLNNAPLKVTNYSDYSGDINSVYSISAVIDGEEQEKSKEVKVLADNYIEIPLKKPDVSKKIKVKENDIEVEKEANLPFKSGEASVADLDGDGQYEIIHKWDPAIARDAGQGGFTGDCIIDAYEMDGTFMWSINMGKNIRSGAHDTQFIVYDFDNDGKAEMACRTADGTIAGDGTVIGDPNADWAALNDGKNLKGPLYLTVFNGEDGTIIDTVPYDPQTFGDGYDHSDWGDTWGNRSERYLASLACVNGEYTSFQMARGYYTGPEGPTGGRTVIASYHLENGKIVSDWRFDTKDYENKYIGQGNHSMASADVDYDGLDEIIYGSLALDHDGTVLFSTDLGHGDAQHTGDIIPSRPGLETFSVHEWGKDKYATDLRDARTGEILSGIQITSDNGRGCAADIDPFYEGDEMWSLTRVLSTADGTVISNDFSLPINFAVYWDGDLGRELQDEIEISKYNPYTMQAEVIFAANGCHAANGGKATSSLTADIFGDWREEVMFFTEDSSALRIYTTTEPTSYRLPTLMHDPQYRNYVALQNVCYNQPTHTSYHIGYATKTIPVPQIYTVNEGKEVKNPDLLKKAWNIDELYTGTKTELAVNVDTGLVNGIPKKIGSAPYIDESDRTMVPIRFIAESLGADVKYDDKTTLITIKNINGTIEMKPGEKSFKLDGVDKEMDTVAVIKDDLTFVPVRFVAEALKCNVGYFSGMVVITDKNPECDNSEERIELLKSLNVPDAPSFTVWGGKSEKTLVRASGKDSDNAKNAADDDINTVWHAEKGDTIIADMGRWGAITRIGYVFNDNKPHKVKIECAGSDEKWETISECITLHGNNGNKDQFIIGITKYKNMVRLTCLDDEGFDLAEIALLEVQ